MLIAIFLSGGDIKPGVPLLHVDKSRLMVIAFYSSPSLIHIHHLYESILTTMQHLYTLIFGILSCLQMYISLKCNPPKWCKKLKMDHTLASICSKAGPKRQKWEKDRYQHKHTRERKQALKQTHTHTHTHTLTYTFILDNWMRISLPLFSTVLPSNSRLFLSCSPSVVITTF